MSRHHHFFIRHEWNDETMENYLRCPGGFLGVKPPTLYTARGYDVMRTLGLGHQVYIPHAMSVS